MVQIYLDPDEYKVLKLYAIENDMTLTKVIKPLTDDFQNSVKSLVQELKTLKQECPKNES